jgi:hypothetical protein
MEWEPSHCQGGGQVAAAADDVGEVHQFHSLGDDEDDEDDGVL